MKRRERTSHLIELGGLVGKTGLVELTDDDRAMLLSLMVEAAAKLQSETGDQVLAIWRRHRSHAFATERYRNDRRAAADVGVECQRWN